MDLGGRGMLQFSLAEDLVRDNIAESSGCRPFRCGWLAQTKALTNDRRFHDQNLAGPTYQILVHMAHERFPLTGPEQIQNFTGLLE
jgi:hypothetical protein